MPYDYEMPWQTKESIRRQIVQHYIRRGVPDGKLADMLCRWLRRHGYRAPCVQ